MTWWEAMENMWNGQSTSTTQAADTKTKLRNQRITLVAIGAAIVYLWG